MATFEDYISVGSTTGFSSYKYVDTSGASWFLGVFESDNILAAKQPLLNQKVKLLMVGGGGGGGSASNKQYSGFCGGGGGGGGHLLLEGTVGSSAIEVDRFYDITVGKKGLAFDTADGSTGSWAGGNTLFGYRQYGTVKCPEVGGGRGGITIWRNSGGEGGQVLNTGATVGFNVLSQGSGGNGGLNGEIGSNFIGLSGENTAAIANSAYGNTSVPGNYYIGPDASAAFGSISIGGGGGGGGGFIKTNGTITGLTGRGGGAGYDGYGGIGGISSDQGTVTPALTAGIDASYSVVIGPQSIAKVGGGGGGGGLPANDATTTSGAGADGIFMVWFTASEFSTGIDLSNAIINPYYTLRYTPAALAYHKYEEVSFPDTSVKGYYTSIIVGGTNADISFSELAFTNGLSAEFLLVGGGGGGAGGNDGYNLASLGSTYSGGGGGGGGHLYCYGRIGDVYDISINTVYDISIGNGGAGRFGSNSGGDGGETVFGHNIWGTPVKVSGGGGGRGQDYDASGVGGTGGFAGTFVSVGPLTNIINGGGGAGGAGATATSWSPPTTDASANGSSGLSAGNGNSGSSGTYNILNFGKIIASGGGGGGGGMRSPQQRYSASSGQGGFAGYGGGGGGGVGPAVDTFFRAQSAVVKIAPSVANPVLGTTLIASAGGGGGGGGIPLANATGEVGVYGGNGGAGLFMVQMVVVISSGVPTLSPTSNPYINVDVSGGYNSYKYSEKISNNTKIDWYLCVFESDNVISFSSANKDKLDNVDATFLLIGGGGGGANAVNQAGSINKCVAGGGGGAGGHLLIETKFDSSLNNFLADTSYNIKVGAGGAGGAGGTSGVLLSGSSGGLTSFGDNVFGSSLCPSVTGGGGGGGGGGSGGIVAGTAGYISNTGFSKGFTVLNSFNNGSGGAGGSGSTGAASSYLGAKGADAASVEVTNVYGDPNISGGYYVGPRNGDFFGIMKTGGGGGGGGGGYDLLAQDTTNIGGGGGGGYQGVGGAGGINTTTAPQTIDYSLGVDASHNLIFGNQVVSYVGAGGGGAGTPYSGITPTMLDASGGAGAPGVLMLWFGIALPLFYETPYYRINYTDTNVLTISDERMFSDGSKRLYYTSLIYGGFFNSITFLQDASGQNAQIFLAGGGGGGGGGTNQLQTFTGQGGGGGGHILGSGKVGVLGQPGVVFDISTEYEIELGAGGAGGFGANQGSDGTGSYFARNEWSSYTYVTGGGGGQGYNYPGSLGAAGDISSVGSLALAPYWGGSGGAGGYGGKGNNPSDVSNGEYGDNASGVNTDVSGIYILPGFGAIVTSGGGGGGGGIQTTTSVSFPDVSGQGGGAGYGFGGAGGVSPYSGTQYNGIDALLDVTTSHARCGGGGGGGGNPPGSIGAVQGGNGADGLFAVHMEIDTSATFTPTTPGYSNGYFALDNSNGDIYIEHLDPSASCYYASVCGGIPGLHYIVITSKNNKIRFTEAAQDMEVEIILVGAGGQGGGGINSIVKHAGQGGGGGGIAYGTGVIGSNIPYNTWLNIDVGNNKHTGGVGVLPGSDGSGSLFGANYWGISGCLAVEGGKGGGVFEDISNGGLVTSYGPLLNISGGSGGNGGTQITSGDGESGENAIVTQTGLAGKYLIPSYGFVVCGGGGGGGAGISGEVTIGSSGFPGRGLGGVGGTIEGHPPDRFDAETIVGAGLSVGGGGGGGAGMPEIGATSEGGVGADGLFVMFFYQRRNCPEFDPICGCGVVSSCPKPVGYKKLDTGGNNPKFNPAIAYALQVRGSVGRPGYQRYNVGNQTLNQFGSYSGAPGGSRAPPKNRF